MSFPARCNHCGHRFISRAFRAENSFGIQIQGVMETCPKCGAMANIQDGTYDFVGSTIGAFRAPGVTREKIERFREIAENVKAGELSTETATAQVDQLGAALAMVWEWTNSHSGVFGVLISLIAVFLTIYYHADSDGVARKYEAGSQQEIQVLEQISDQLRRQGVNVPMTLEVPSSKNQIHKVIQGRKRDDAKPNRHARRKAANLSRRSK